MSTRQRNSRTILGDTMTHMPRLLIFAAFAIIGVGPCVAFGESPAPKFKVDSTDVPAQKRFFITFHSLDKRPLCLRYFQWPSLGGELSGGSWVALKSSEGVYRAAGHNFGYHVSDGDDIRIAPFSTLTGFILYSEFGNPRAINKLRRRR